MAAREAASPVVIFIRFIAVKLVRGYFAFYIFYKCKQNKKRGYTRECNLWPRMDPPQMADMRKLEKNKGQLAGKGLQMD